jgi:outer membrane lipoprotein-sorting protein
MNSRILIAGVSIILLMAGCTESETLKREGAVKTSPSDLSVQDESMQEERASSVLAKAEQIYSKAKEQQHSWTTTAKMIDAARKALETGDENAAMVAAKRALFTAEASLAQAQSQEDAWQARVPQ